MMSGPAYSVRIKRSAAKELTNLPEQNRLRVTSVIIVSAINPWLEVC